ncbi:MAG TPA: sigma-70 family RNA polymerase sigma factor [Ktedonobacterales bacterium]
MLLEEHENQLVMRASGRDHEAFTELYRLYNERIYRYVRLKLGSPTDAEDITSVVFCNAWRTIDHFAPHRDTSFAAWLFRIAHHAIIDRYRRFRETVSLNNEQNQPAALAVQPGPEAQIERQIEIDELYAALELLTPEQREVVLLRFVEGLSAREVGQIMGKQEGAVRGMQFRAIESLRRALARGAEAAQ